MGGIVTIDLNLKVAAKIYIAAEFDKEYVEQTKEDSNHNYCVLVAGVRRYFKTPPPQKNLEIRNVFSFHN